MADYNEDLFKDFEKYKKGESKEDKTKKIDEKEIVIRFKFKPIMVERIAYWVIILVLLALVIVSPLSNLVKCGSNQTIKSGESVQAGGATITDAPATQTTADTAPTTSQETDSQDQQTQQTTAVILPNQIAMAIQSITVEKDEAGVPKKVIEVVISVNNGGADFKPRFEIYWYDKSDAEEIQSIKRMDVTFPTLPAGTSKDYTLSKFVSKYITDYQDDETVYIKLYDKESGNLLKETSKKIV